jgi:hypothetical protein
MGRRPRKDNTQYFTSDFYLQSPCFDSLISNIILSLESEFRLWILLNTAMQWAINNSLILIQEIKSHCSLWLRQQFIEIGLWDETPLLFLTSGAMQAVGTIYFHFLFHFLLQSFLWQKIILQTLFSAGAKVFTSQTNQCWNIGICVYPLTLGRIDWGVYTTYFSKWIVRFTKKLCLFYILLSCWSHLEYTAST